ncbi:MAG: cyclodeaminase/cyclohydrolase family protein [Methylocystaceae bacterium]
MLPDMSVQKYITELASNSPAPGGGSVAALSGAQGAALISMVSELTVGKPGYEEAETIIKTLGEKAAATARELVRLMDVDAEVFPRVIAAFKLPKTSDEEKDKRTAAIQVAYKAAADVPMLVAGECLQILKLCPEALAKGNKNALSDVGVAAHSAWCGLQCALLNVKINLSGIKDKSYVDQARQQMALLTDEGKELFTKVAAGVESSL